MLKQKYLKFKGIGRFVEEQIIVFDTLSKFVQLGGQNNNTKGSSGAGKSTVFMAEDYLFGVSNRPGTVLKSRLSEEILFVEGGFDWDGKEVIVARGKKLSISIDGVTTVGNSDKTEEKLDEIIGMPRKLFRQMLHKRQKEGGFFLDMTPADTDTFLMNALGLGVYKAKIKIADDKIGELTEKSKDTVTKLASVRSALKATQDAVESMGPELIREMDQATVLSLKEKAEKSAAAWAALSSTLRLEEEALNASRPQVTQEPFDKSAREGYEKYLKEIREFQNSARLLEMNRQAEINSLISARNADKVHYSTLIKNADKAKQVAVGVALKIKKIRESLCPTCEQGWVTENARITEASLLEEIKTLKQVIADGAAASEKLVSVQVDLNRLAEQKIPIVPKGMTEAQAKEMELEGLILANKNEELSHWTAQKALNSKTLDTFATKCNALRENHRGLLDHARGQADIDRRTFEAAVGKLRAYEEARATREGTRTRLAVMEASYTNKISELTNLSVQIHNELAMAEELKRGLKSYLSCSFDEALDTISKNATDLIRHIPNMANATIQLEGVKETQDGKIKEEVTAVIHMDGEENVPIKSLCGGERTATDLAIDLSVIDMLENKANKGIDLFILDEPFDGLDTVCIEMALEVLKNSNSNKRLIIVDHNPEVKEMVESKLLVVRDGATSRIVQS